MLAGRGRGHGALAVSEHNARTEILQVLRSICLDGSVGSSHMTGLRAGMYAASDAPTVRRAAYGGFCVSQSVSPLETLPAGKRRRQVFLGMHSSPNADTSLVFALQVRDETPRPS